MNLKKLSVYKKIEQFAKDKKLDFTTVYGSYYLDKNIESSDIDLIIDSKNYIDSEKIGSYSKELGKILNLKIDIISARMIISLLVCGYVWRLKQYYVIYGAPVISEES